MFLLCAVHAAITWQEISIGFTARCQHTVSYYKGGDCAIVFGGYNVRTKHLSDVWVLDLSAPYSIWQASDYGQLPHERRGHVAHVIGDSLWVFGGACETDVLGDVLCLCLKTWKWQQVRIPINTISGPVWKSENMRKWLILWLPCRWILSASYQLVVELQQAALWEIGGLLCMVVLMVPAACLMHSCSILKHLCGVELTWMDSALQQGSWGHVLSIQCVLSRMDCYSMVERAATVC